MASTNMPIVYSHVALMAIQTTMVKWSCPYQNDLDGDCDHKSIYDGNGTIKSTISDMHDLT